MRTPTYIWLKQFVKFCFVGGSGVIVDMLILHLLVHVCGLNVTLGKIWSGETAMLNNFVWNELWTFQDRQIGSGSHSGVYRRLWRFHAICGLGIVIAVVLLNFFYRGLKLNLYLSNLLAIVMVTLWNFIMNAFFNWKTVPKHLG